MAEKKKATIESATPALYGDTMRFSPASDAATTFLKKESTKPFCEDSAGWSYLGSTHELTMKIAMKAKMLKLNFFIIIGFSFHIQGQP